METELRTFFFIAEGRTAGADAEFGWGNHLGGIGRTTHKKTKTMKTQNKEIAHKIIIKEIMSSMSWDFSIQMIAVD